MTPAERPEILMTPGPVPVPPQVLAAQGAPLVYHRGPGYGALLREVTDGLQKLLRTRSEVLVFSASGTGAMESAVANLFSPGDRVVAVVAGYFGARFAGIAEAFGLDVVRLDYEWGKEARPEDLKAALGEPAKGVLLQHSETSTGVVHDIEALASVAKEAGALVVVDVVSSLGAMPYEGDAWGIDVAVGGSQKALSATPGLSFVSVSEAAWEASRAATSPRFYFDWLAYKEAFELADPEHPFTPAISLMLGLREAIRLFFAEGPEAVLERHRVLSEATKEGIRALGLDLFGEHPERAWAVTAVRVPEGVDCGELLGKIRSDHGIVIAGGQGPNKGHIFRIGHLGYYDRFDIIRGLAAIELTLADLGYPVKRGAAVAAAEEVFASAS